MLDVVSVVDVLVLGEAGRVVAREELAGLHVTHDELVQLVPSDLAGPDLGVMLGA